jgi:hypothetical protein
MYKVAGRNLQSRARNLVKYDHRNSYGVDPTSYRDQTPASEWQLEIDKINEQRRDLRKKVVELEDEASALKLRIRYATKAKALDYIDLRTSAIHKLTETQTQLSKLTTRLKELNRIHNRTMHSRVEPHFAQIFVELAQEMLAQPVFERISIATTHRIAERKENP